MNSDPSKLRQQQQQSEQSSDLQFREELQAHQFDSVEEMIRFDARQTEPPAEIAERLKESVAHEPKPARSWWKRLFGKRA